MVQISCRCCDNTPRIRSFRSSPVFFKNLSIIYRQSSRCQLLACSAATSRSALGCIWRDGLGRRSIDTGKRPESWGWRRGNQSSLDGCLVYAGGSARLYIGNQNLRQRSNRYQFGYRQLGAFHPGVSLFLTNRRLHVNDLLAGR